MKHACGKQGYLKSTDGRSDIKPNGGQVGISELCHQPRDESRFGGVGYLRTCVGSINKFDKFGFNLHYLYVDYFQHNHIASTCRAYPLAKEMRSRYLQHILSL
ncbi:hypothetical protein PG987_009738 [Apiospora arundinis]